MILPVITYPNENLRKKSEELSVEKIASPEVQSFITDLIETMLKEDGLGLAAVQVDKHWRIFAVATEDGPMVFINPKISFKSWFKEMDEEGCLSIPGVFGTVKRPKAVIIKSLDRNGEKVSMKATGLFARVIQHEFDHVNGDLFIDKIQTVTRGQEILDEMKAK